MKDEIQKLIGQMNDEQRKDVTAYKVYQITGISQATLSDLKSGAKDVGSLSINNGQKLIDSYKILNDQEEQTMKITSIHRQDKKVEVRLIEDGTAYDVELNEYDADDVEYVADELLNGLPSYELGLGDEADENEDALTRKEIIEQLEYYAK